MALERKGFMHSLEGTIAALLLLFYAFQLFENMSVYRADWVPASTKQEMQEFIFAMKGSDYREMLFEGNLSEFIGVSRYFLGESRGYSVKITGLPKAVLEVGVITNETINVAGTINATLCPVATEFSCYNASFKGVNYVLADYDGALPNGREYYNTLYFDFNGDSAYSASEGPFSENNIISVGGVPWSIGRIDNATGNVSFLDATKLAGMLPNLKDFTINGRRTRFSVRGAAFNADMGKFDVILVPGNVNMSPYESQMMEFLQQGGGIVALRNITSAADVRSVEQKIFGLLWVSNDTTGADQSGVLSAARPGKRAYDAKKYFIHSGIFTGTSGTNTLGYDTTGIPNAGTAHIGNTTLRMQTYAILVTKSIASPVYDRIWIDFNSPRNNFTDETGLSVGSSVVIDGNNYTVKRISLDGGEVVLKGDESHVFADFLPPGQKVYPVSVSEDSIIAKGKADAYNITSRAVSSSTIIPLAACTGGEATMPAGIHKCGVFYAGAYYNFSATNTSLNYTLYNIDLNANGLYNDKGEGPFSTGTLMQFGPESYRVLVSYDGAGVMWVLEKRWPIPYAVMNSPASGTAAWMPDSISSHDEWSLFVSTLAAAGRNYAQIGRGSAIGTWVSAKGVFFEMNETFQPYEVELMTWY